MRQPYVVLFCCSLLSSASWTVTTAGAQQAGDVRPSLQQAVQQAIQQAGQPKGAFGRSDRPAPLLEMTVGELRHRSVLVRPVTLHAVNRPLGDILKLLDRQAELRLVYSPSLVPISNRVTLLADSMPVGRALSQALSGLGVTIVVTSAGQVVLAGPGQQTAYAPAVASNLAVGSMPQSVANGILRGIVVDAIHKRPMAKVVVSVAGTKLKALTDEKGGFLIDGIPEGAHELVGALPGQLSTSQPFVMLDGAEIQVELILGGNQTASIARPTR